MDPKPRNCPIWGNICDRGCFILHNLEDQAATGGGLVTPGDLQAGPLWSTYDWDRLCTNSENQAINGGCPERDEVRTHIARLTLQKLADGTIQ